MKIIIGIVFLLIGFLGFTISQFKEDDKKTRWKMLGVAISGALAEGGLILLFL